MIGFDCMQKKDEKWFIQQEDIVCLNKQFENISIKLQLT